MLSHLNVQLFGDDFEEKDWAFWMQHAYLTAKRSPDPSTQNGALLFNPDGQLIGSGYNEFPFRVEYKEERWERPLKYEIIEHAERNSVYCAARMGHSTVNAAMIVPWAACSDCARAIIQSGTKRLVRHVQSTVRGQGRNWDGTISTADTMLKEAGVQIIDLDWNFGDEDLTILHSGTPFTP